ncbi:MAG: AI-2E family transporter [Actinobacteria bacterium]|nr:MAG: AI-2E family transporter [Actinomycetota bacterium]
MRGSESTGGTPPGPDAPVHPSLPRRPPSWPPVAYWVRTTLAVVATLVVVAAARRVTHILLLVVIAFVLAVGLDPAVRRLERNRVKRGWAVTLIFAGLALFFLLFAVLLIPPMARQIRQLADAVPSYVAHLETRHDWIGNAARHSHLSTRLQQFVAEIPTRIARSFSSIVGFAGTVLGGIFDLFTVGILTVYFMLSLPRMRDVATSFTPPQHRARVATVIDDSVKKIGGYVSGNLATSAVCGVFTIVALLVIRVPYAVPLGMWAGVADLIPQVGSYLGAIPAVLVALIKGPAYGIATVLYFIAYQQFENYLLAPRIYQNAIDLSPAAVIVSTLIGGSLAGFAGALLALPVAATIKVVTHDIMLAEPEGLGDEGE